MSQPRPYSRVEIVNGQVIPIYDDPEPEEVKLVIREISQGEIIGDEISQGEIIGDKIEETETETVVETDDDEIYDGAAIEKEDEEEAERYCKLMNALIDNGLRVDEAEDDANLSPEERFEAGKMLRSVKDADGTEYFRHPKYKEYACDFKTGEIVRMKSCKNEVNNKLAVNLKNGITLSLGSKDGKRQQKHYAPQKFVAETGLYFGKLTQKSALHTQITINTKSQSYIKRPNLKLYPLSCLSFEMAGDIKYGNPKNMTGSALRNRVKTADQIDAYVRSVRRENERLEMLNNGKDGWIQKQQDEISKLKETIAKLQEENNRFSDAQNTPLKAGALQLQQLLMTKVDGTTFKDMLQFCFKDITRNYPTEDDAESFLSDTDENDRNDAHFGVFDFSPVARGCEYDDEHITR